MAVLFTYFMFTDSAFRSVPAFLVSAGFGSAAVIVGKIAVTGRSWQFFDRRVASVENSAAFGLAGDILSAIVVNVVAYPLSLVSASVPGLVLLVPMGIFGMHCLFVGFYAYWQIRKKRRLRAVLAGCIALVFVIVMARNLRIA
jgi:hypothetical protein